MAEAKLPFYFSVDFEDFGHDYRRVLGERNPPCNEAAYRRFHLRVRWARPVQWIKVGHKGVERKRGAICKHFEHQGPMRLAAEGQGARLGAA